MVAGTPHQMEWSVPADDHSRYCDRNRRIHNRMGGLVSRSENRWALVNGREPDAHKLSRAASSNSGNQIICQGKEKHSHPPDDGQHDSSDIHKQVWGHSLPRAEQTHQRAMVVVPGEGYNTTSEPPSRCPQLHSRRRVACDAGQIRQVAMPQGFQQDQYQTGQLQVDSFASRLTHQLSNYASWRPDPGVMATDAFRTGHNSGDMPIPHGT